MWGCNAISKVVESSQDVASSFDISRTGMWGHVGSEFSWLRLLLTIKFRTAEPMLWLWAPGFDGAAKALSIIDPHAPPPPMLFPF